MASAYSDCIQLSPLAMEWVNNSALNYEISAEDYLQLLIQNEIRRINEIASKGHTDCDCGRDIKPTTS